MVDAVVEGIPGDELTVERVRTEVRALTERIAAKQWEVQLMVGSRYHELIDSADSVVSMYRSCKRLQLSLGDFKGHLHSLSQQKPAPHLIPPGDPTFIKAGQGENALVRSNVLFMVHAPTQIWEAIDHKQLLPATRAYLRAKAIAQQACSAPPTRTLEAAPQEGEAASEDLDKVKAVVLRQWAYISDLSKAIKQGGYDLLASQDVAGTEAHAAALGALCLVEGLSPQQALKTYLEARSLWLHDDFSSTMQSLDGDVETVRLKLTRAVQALSRTIIDTHRILTSTQVSSHLQLEDLDLPSVGRLAVAEAVTQWVSKHIEETYRRSQAMLKLVRTSNELAKVRQAIWAEARVAESDQLMWKEACSSLILMDKLRSSLSRGLSMSLPFSNTSASLDLWTVLFSRSFAVLAENLLSEALAKVRTALVQQLESVLVMMRGEQHRGKLTAVEMAWAAEYMGRDLTAQVASIGRQADSLVQEGDSHASGALAVSLRTQTLRLLAHVVAYLRSLATALAEDEQVDGLLILVRLAWYLGRNMGAGLDECPAAAHSAGTSALRSSSSRGEATIDIMQLESAFTIADTRGEGVLSQEELKDALDTIGLGGSSTEGLLSSCTLPEFALLCSPILEEQRPSRFLKEALEAVFRQGLAAWAAVAVKHPAATLHASVSAIDGGGKGSMSDAVWRSRHAGWEEKLLLQEDEAGGTLEDRVWLPSHVSPWYSVYLFSISMELSRVTQSRDCLEPGLGTDPCLMEAFRHSLVERARREIHTSLKSIKATGLCEAAVLQCTLDHLFLRQWLQQEEAGGEGETSLPGWDSLQQVLDPINYQMYEPVLLEAVRAQSAASSLILSFLLQRTAGGAPSSSRGGAVAALPAAGMLHSRSLSMSNNDSRKARASSLTAADDASTSTIHHHPAGSNTIPLVTTVPRFTLLPVVVEASTPASSRIHSPPRDPHSSSSASYNKGGAFGFNFSAASDPSAVVVGTSPVNNRGGGKGGGGGAAGGVGHAATVLSSFSSLSALGNQAASTATSFLSRATSSNKRS